MAVPTNKFTVEHYQINCSEDGAGECAIMLLVRFTSDKPKGTVERTVLIDAGWSVKAVRRLKETLDRLESKYGENIKFDAVSISHWDQDHYHGFVSFMQNKEVTTWTDNMCCWFKYDAENKNAPLTHLYAQRWDRKIKGFFQEPTTGTVEPLTFNVNGSKKANVCLGHFTTENVLGTNIFRNSEIPTNSATSIHNLSDLLRYNPLWDPSKPSDNGSPGLYVVGVNRQILGPNRVGVISNRSSKISWENAGSILLLLVWNDSTISLYSGGDAEFPQEDDLADWLNERTVSVIKAGHHGSRIGTSTNFVHATQPQFFLISAGRLYRHPVSELIFYLDAYFSHQQRNHALRGSVDQKRIYSVCFPYYLGLFGPSRALAKFISVHPNFRFMNAKRFTAGFGGAPVADFQGALDHLYEGAPNTPLYQLRSALEDIEGAIPARQALTTIVRNQWERWGALTHKYYPFGGSTLESACDTSSSICLESIHVTFTPGDTQFEIVDSRSMGTSTSSSSVSSVAGPVLYARSRRAMSLGSGDRAPPSSPPAQRRKLNGSYYTLPRDEEIVWPLRDVAQILSQDESVEEPDLGREIPRAVDVTTVGATAAPLLTYPWNFQTILASLALGDQEPGSMCLNANSNEDLFLLQTETQVLQLANPVTLTAADTTWTGLVGENDELVRWFSELFLDSDSTSFNLSGRGNRLEMFSTTRMPFHGPMSPKLVFTSDISVLQKVFGIDQDILSSILDKNGLVSSTCELILALDIAQCEHLDGAFSLSNLYNLLELKVPTWLNNPDALSSNSLSLQTQSTEPGVEVINALWFMPGYNYTTTFRLQAMENKTTGSTVRSRLFVLLPKCAIDSPTFVCTKSMKTSSTMALASGADQNVLIESNLTIRTCVQLHDGALSHDVDKTKGYWDTYLIIEDTSVMVILQWNGTEDPLAGFLTWIEDRIGVKETFSAFKNLLTSAKATTGLALRQARFKIDYPNTFNSFALDFQADLSWGSSSSEPCPFLLTFSWQRLSSDGRPLVSFTGGLWTTTEDSTTYKLSPQNPVIPPPLRPTGGSYSSTFSIMKLPGIQQISNAVDLLPPEFPTEFSGLSIAITEQGVSFSGTMGMNPQQNGKHSFPLFEVSLDTSWMFDGTSPLSIAFNAIVPLQTSPSTEEPVSDDPPLVPYCVCSINFESGKWILTARAEDLYGKYLYSLFPRNGDQDTAIKALEHINIPLLNVIYTYDKDLGNSFEATGLIRFGDAIDLDLTFNMYRDNTNWDFSAVLSPDSAGGISMGEFMSSISKDLGKNLPEFLFGINFTVDASSKLQLDCHKCPNGTLVLCITAEIDNFEFTFVQMVEKGTSTGPKRMLRFTVDTLPPVTSIPFINTLPQPFSRMDFLWLSDDFLKSEMDLLNAVVFSDEPIPYVNPTTQITSQSRKPVSSESQNVLSATSPVVLDSGSHFLILDTSHGTPSIVLEYFFRPKTRQNSSGAVNANKATNNADTSKSAPYVAKFGPLSISGLGLFFKDESICISVDASIALGPLTGALNGFALSIPLEKLTNLTADDLSVSMQGMGLSLDKHPLSISGMLIKQGYDAWAGGISINYDPYAFMAGGLYQHVALPGTGSGSVPTVFVFARLDGPLVELEFASISGITGGFGFNSAMTTPDVSNVADFPFLRGDLEASSLAVLENFLNPTPITWFALAENSFWLAAGLTCTAFQVLHTQAVATLSWGNEITLGVFADCTAKVPFAETSEDKLFLLVELGIVAVVDQGKGTFHCEGELTPTSFILNPSCHLTGGFVLCYWFQGSGHEGDWVFTVGGYHSAFKRPSHYPSPSRLGISWKYDSTIDIHGEAYFAITPKVCMGGGRLDLTFQDGVLHAYFNAWADFLVNYKPFTFVGDVGVSVGIGFTIHIWFFTINFNVHFGADVHLQGPPVTGYVFVGWDIISFTIHFGQSEPVNEALGWDEMWALLRQGDNAAGAEDHVIAATRGLASTQAAEVTVKSNEGWNVMAGLFRFTVKTLFPITVFTYDQPDGKVLSHHFDGDPTFVKPMHIQKGQKVTSELHITIASPERLVSFPVEPIVELVPTALWGSYDPENDPNDGKSPADLLDPSGSTVQQLMGIQFNTPHPQLSEDKMLPFNVQAACSFYVFDKSPAIPVPNPVHPEFIDAWTPDINAGDAEVEWHNARGREDILPAWTAVLDGGKPGYAAKLYQGLDATLPRVVFEKWMECFPVSPVVSRGSL